MGDKQRESQRMKYRLACQGWVVISANYRLNPEGKFPDFLIDLKRVIAWARSEGLAFGVDPERIFLAGSSAGAHISAMAALTPGRPDLQPGFEEVETPVQGVIGLYGYYGRLNVSGEAAQAIPSSPIDLAHPDAPPFLLIDAGHDSVIGPESTKQLLAALETAGSKVARAELPGAEHTFDFLRSVRTENTIDAIEDFATWALSAEKPG
jgi:acetyl esterase/lipase